MKLTLPLPPKCLHPNARSCWQAKVAATRKCRAEAALVARTAPDKPSEPWVRATIQATFYMPRRHDPDNLLAWAKSAFDGLQGIVIENDSGFTHLSPRQITGKDVGRRLELEIQPVEEA